MAMALPIAPMVLWPLTFHGVKLPVLMKNSPAVDMIASGMNLMIVVHSWTAAMLLVPTRLITAGIQRPTSAITIDQPVIEPLLMKCST